MTYAGVLSAIATSVLSVFSTAQAAPGQVYVNLFEWKYSDIAKECRDFLGPKGFSAVQISVPTEAKANTNQWWERYQPASYKLISRSGNRDDLVAMVNTCRDAGVAIYADVVLNHMANGTGTGMAGCFYSDANRYDCVPYGPNDFNPKVGINYGNEWSVQHGWMGENGSPDLPDLKTDTPWVQQKLSAYLKDLLNAGVAGFRIDAAKHIPASDLKTIVEQAGPLRSDIAQKFGLQKPWVTHEVFGGWDAISGNQQGVYFSFGTANEFKYRDIMRKAFDRRGESVAALYDKIPITGERPNPWGFYPSYLATVFVDNHDTERHDSSMNYGYGKKYNLANIFMLAYPYGQPQLMSGFKLFYPSDSQGRKPNDQPVPTVGAFNGDALNMDRWIFTHRWKEIANMVEWRNQAQSVWRVDDWTTDGADRVAFHRGDKAFVAINNTGSAWQNTFKVGMKDGVYCNVTAVENPNNASCPAEAQVRVSGGNATISVPPESAVAIHAGGNSTSCDDPADFSFDTKVNADVSSVQVSKPVVVSGLSCNARISVTGGKYRLNGGAFTSADGTVKNGDTLELQVVASSSLDTATSATVTVGKDSAAFKVVTGTDPGNECTDAFCPKAEPLDYQAIKLIAGQSATLYYKGSLKDSASVKMHVGFNGWKNVVDVPMKKRADGFWEGAVTAPADATMLDVVFTNGSQWDNNGAKDWHLPVNGACTTGCGTQPVISFKVTAYTQWGESVYITGNQAELGNWSAAADASRKCEPTAYPEWTCKITFGAGGKAIAYKYLKLGMGTKWESGANRTYSVPSESTTKNDGSFRQ